uniref:Claudin n=1 Tax=Cyclopterus lumpus TaxID=8103 RepID=A0A8C2Z5K3_CYCLU
MAPSVLQNGGFILGLVGAVALIAATSMNKWSVKDRQGDVVTSVYTYKGLWRDCETASSGFTECRPLYGLLGFSAFQAVRALMIVGVVLGILGAVISVFSLTCLTMNSMADTTKAKMSLTAGIMFMIAGLCGIAGASIYANQIVILFFPSYSPYYLYTFGPALFVAWIGGGILLIGGILKSVAFKEMVKDEKSHYPGVTYKPQPRTKTDHQSEGGKKDQNYV